MNPAFTFLKILFVALTILADTTSQKDAKNEMKPMELPQINLSANSENLKSTGVSGKDLLVDNMDDEAEPADAEILAIMEGCNDTFRISMEYINSLSESGSFPDENDKTPKCYVRCMLEKLLVVTSDGVFDVVRADQVLGGTRNGVHMSDGQEMATKCAVRDETCKCERSYNFMKCLMEAQIEKYGH